MKFFLLKVILLLSLVTPKLFADITQAQLDEYMKVSRGGQVLDYYKRKIFKESSHLGEVKDRTQVINRLEVMLKNEEILEKFNKNFINLNSTFNDSNYNETTSKISYLFFKDFSEDELEKIVDYALSDAGQQEYKLIEAGITAYTNEFIRRVLMLYYPFKCVSE